MNTECITEQQIKELCSKHGFSYDKKLNSIIYPPCPDWTVIDIEFEFQYRKMVRLYFMKYVFDKNVGVKTKCSGLVKRIDKLTCEAFEKYLEEYPSIQVVLDIHRDAIEQSGGVRIKPTAKILGKKAAQLMIITGCEEGKVTDFPDWERNLTFALRLQSICEEKFPGLMRPLYFCQRKYNMDLSPNNLLVEVGSCANTLEEAVYAGRLLGNSLATLLDRSIEGNKNEKTD